jgi:hypothetical protein
LAWPSAGVRFLPVDDADVLPDRLHRRLPIVIDDRASRLPAEAVVSGLAGIVGASHMLRGRGAAPTCRLLGLVALAASMLPQLLLAGPLRDVCRLGSDRRPIVTAPELWFARWRHA